MESKEVINKIKDLVSPILEEEAVELVDITYRWERDRMVLRFLIDKRGGITVDECASLNQKLSSLLDEANVIEATYVLEVSSPGLDRPLATTKDFMMVLGKLIKVYSSISIGARNVNVGRLSDVDEEKITIDIEEGLRLNIPRDKITKAVQDMGF